MELLDKTFLAETSVPGNDFTAISMLNQWVFEFLVLFSVRPAVPVSRNVLSVCGSQFLFRAAIAGNIVHGKVIYCVSDGPWRCRMFPYYWDRTGSRHLYWQYYDKSGVLHTDYFFHFYIGQTPKNR